MTGNIICIVWGVCLGIILLGVNGATLNVSSTDVERAMLVCKEGKWNYINNKDIVCADGAKYSRYEKGVE